MNRAEAIQHATGQMKAIDNRTHVNRPVSVVMSGEPDEAPAWLAHELEQIIGKPVSIEWKKVTKSGRPINNAGLITDGIGDYYEDAARRGARTGD